MITINTIQWTERHNLGDYYVWKLVLFLTEKVADFFFFLSSISNLVTDKIDKRPSDLFAQSSLAHLCSDLLLYFMDLGKGDGHHTLKMYGKYIYIV